MNSKLHQRLKELDRIGGWESPHDLDYPRAAEEIERQKSALETILGCNLEGDGGQDAAFIGEYRVLDPRYVGIKSGDLVFTAHVQTVSIRFSAFDRMFTIFGTELDTFTERIPAAIEHLTKQGFRYVSYEDLAARYDGVSDNGTHDWTWFTRFFDYL